MRLGLLIPIVAALGIALPGRIHAATPAGADRLDAQRSAFRAAWERVEDYVLWPDLRAAWLQTRIRNNDYAEVEPFLAKYGSLKPARELRYRYVLTLGRSHRYDHFLNLYESHYADLGVARLDCLALQADIESGRNQLVPVRGMDAWLVGRNQVEECDPVFEHMRQHGLLSEDAYADRFELAVDARQFGIARYLSRSLPVSYSVRARQWTSIVDDPAAFLEAHDAHERQRDTLAQLAYAVERLAYDDPERAAELWHDIGSRYPFEKDVRLSLDRHVALWAARRHSPRATQLLEGLDASSRDTEVLRWSARAGLLRGDWASVVASIGAMPTSEQGRSEWRYWLAYAQDRSGNRSQASAVNTSSSMAVNSTRLPEPSLALHNTCHPSRSKVNSSTAAAIFTPWG